MAAPVRLEGENFDDPDVDALATILGYEDRDTAVGKLAALGRWCRSLRGQVIACEAGGGCMASVPAARATSQRADRSRFDRGNLDQRREGSVIARGQSLIDLGEVAPPGPDELHLTPLDSLRQAARFIGLHHRHSKPPKGWKVGVGAARGRVLVGVAVVGRPVSRELDKLRTVAEVTRLCVRDREAHLHQPADWHPPLTAHASGAPTMLYAACWRAASALGYRRMVTYTLPHESGVSLRAAGYILVEREAGGGTWSRSKRERADDHDTSVKLRWEIGDIIRPTAAARAA